METILKFIGIEKIETILVEPTLGARAEEKAKMVNKAKEQAQHLEDRFNYLVINLRRGLRESSKGLHICHPFL